MKPLLTFNRALNDVKVDVRKIAHNRAKPTGNVLRMFGGKGEEKALIKKSNQIIQYFLGRMGVSS